MVHNAKQSDVIHRFAYQGGYGEPDIGHFLVITIPMRSVSYSRAIIASDAILGNLDRIIADFLNLLSDRRNPFFPGGRELSTCTPNRIKLNVFA